MLNWVVLTGLSNCVHQEKSG